VPWLHKELRDTLGNDRWWQDGNRIGEPAVRAAAFVAVARDAPGRDQPWAAVEAATLIGVLIVARQILLSPDAHGTHRD
jgi:hypothetical protein